jgi:phosphatidylserine/phosphatidylglycerophosphate/cardiolipin synthase-like enzyme
MTDWFLPRAERAWSSGNLVIPRVHGAAYFARLAEVVGEACHGDEIYFTDWRGDADQLMTAAGPSIGQLLCDAAGRGVQVRGLLWRSHSDLISFSARENQKLGVEIIDGGGQALLDQRVRRGGSHHQKMFVLRHRDRPDADLAFVGGVDLCHSRRDDAAHAGDPQRQPMDRRYGPRPPCPWVHTWCNCCAPTPASDHRSRSRQRASARSPVATSMRLRARPAGLHRGPVPVVRQRGAHTRRGIAPRARTSGHRGRAAVP